MIQLLVPANYIYKMNNFSKPLTNSDESGFYFAQEMLDGDSTAGINFDRLQKHPEHGYIIFEYLLCDEKQKYVTPLTSHPSKYWYKNSKKFISLWTIAHKLEAKLFLVNYAKKNTLHQDKILLIEVLALNEKGIVKEVKTEFNRKSFSTWFRKLNHACLL